MGAQLRLGTCSDAGSQQWSYQDDGMLRSALDPTLCLAADPGRHSVVVAGCLVHAGEVSYDLTVRGELVLRWDRDLALAADGTRVVVARRSGAAGQRWELEPGEDGVAVTPRPAQPAPPAPQKGETPGTSEPPPLPVVPQNDPGEPQQPYATRVAQVGAPRDPVPGTPTAPREPVGPVSEAVGDVLDSVPATVTDVVGSVPDVVSGVGGLLG
ncbi:ricin-type beta-trefoil lectin domain protein [Streptomyces sp. NPDC059627]